MILEVILLLVTAACFAALCGYIRDIVEKLQAADRT